jgi:hypothetical protein
MATVSLPTPTLVSIFAVAYVLQPFKCREYDGRVPSMVLVDELLDERTELTGEHDRA